MTHQPEQFLVPLDEGTKGVCRGRSRKRLQHEQGPGFVAGTINYVVCFVGLKRDLCVSFSGALPACLSSKPQKKHPRLNAFSQFSSTELASSSGSEGQTPQKTVTFDF